jgi:hypothetical protein
MYSEDEVKRRKAVAKKAAKKTAKTKRLQRKS